MKHKIAITVDVNDADYRVNEVSLDDNEFELLKKMAKKIAKFEPYVDSEGNKCDCNFNVHDSRWESEKTPQEYYGFTDEEVEFIENMVGWLDYGFHTIKSIVVVPTEINDLLKQGE